MATESSPDAKTEEGDVSIDLSAPAGWKKKFTPKKGATPGRNEIVFVAPDGEEIKTKSQLRGYLKSHSAGVTFKEFDWSTGDTPRRSSRLSGKSNASESPDNDTPRKRQRKSSAEKEKEGSEDEATNEGGNEATEASNADAKDAVEHDDKDMEKDDTEDPVKGGDVGEPSAEEGKAAAEGQEAAPEEQKTDAMEQDAATEEEKLDVKEHEAAADDEQKSDVKEQEAAADDEQKSDVKEQEAVVVVEEKTVIIEVGSADMNVLLGTDDNEAKEDVQQEIGEMKKEGGDVSESNQSNGGDEKGVENNASLPSEANKRTAECWSDEDWSITIPHGPGTMVMVDGTSDFLAAMPDDILLDAKKSSVETADPKVEEACKVGSSKDEAVNQISAAKVDAVMEDAARKEKQDDLSNG